MTARNKDHVMRKIKLEKITLNIGCGTKLSPETAKNILERITKRKAVITRSKKRSLFGIPKNKPIGSKITIREGAQELLNKILEAVERKIPSTSFDNTGNVSFGIPEYIDIPGQEYDPKIGIVGMDVCITLARPGYRIRKKRVPSKISKNHLITREESIRWFQENFNVRIE